MDSTHDLALSVPALIQRYRTVRATTERLCAPLATEDYVLQAMPDASPPRWHLAHTTWFFENFLLSPFLPGYRPFHPRFAYLFNSYYESQGPFFPRARRGHLSRPTVAEIYEYRRHVDGALCAWLERLDGDGAAELRFRTVLGLNHEQQHQELLLTDLKYNFSVNPLRPAYAPPFAPVAVATADTPGWTDYTGGVYEIGHAGSTFAFDNETPRHRVLLNDYRLADRLVNCGEYLEFIADDGYRRPELWLSDGWATVRRERWDAPLYWELRDGQWQLYTLCGMRPLDLHEPVCHLSYFEADAYARWRGARLPTEAEWEHAAAPRPRTGNLLDGGRLHPQPAPTGTGLRQIYGDVWEWTASPYVSYPGFRPLAGGLGEYNGKFMCNQFVLRGGSCATPADHLRPTYRNFFYPDARWQYSGLRLAADGER